MSRLRHESSGLGQERAAARGALVVVAEAVGPRPAPRPALRQAHVGVDLGEAPS